MLTTMTDAAMILLSGSHKDSTESDRTATMDNITFGTAPVPAVKSGRSAEPNPFSDHFPTPEGQALTVTLPGTAEANKEKVTNLSGKARRAASTLDTPMTARIQVSENGKGRNAETVLTIWTVSKITRKRGEVDSATE